jgi:hypothetical protein
VAGKALTVAETSVAAEIHEAFDIHGNLGTEFTLHLEVSVNDLSDIVYLFFGQVTGLGCGFDT